jgi:fumarate reductase flavoprotein subunit
MQKTMEESAGIYRNGIALANGVETLRRLQERYAHIRLEDHSKTFNTERVTALELGFMLDVAEAMLNAAIRHEESRGAHQRTDFPARDDQRFLAHSLCYRGSDGSPRLEFRPVTITRWPPGERVYGEAAPHAGAHQVTDRAVSS